MILRKQYIKKISQYKEKELVKVITGIRRCGKSVLMDQYIEQLINNGVKKDNIIKINFEEKEVENLLDKDELYKYLISKYKDTKSGYL